MPNKLLIVAAAALLTAVACPVLAQSSASTTGTGSITIVRPITITKTADRAFGTAVRPERGPARSW